MQTSKVLNRIACASFITITSFATADTISPEVPNAAFAPVTILESHPQCERPGTVAFRVDFAKDDLGFQLDVGDDTIFFPQSAADGLMPADPICTRKERRGTVVMRLQVDCDDERRPITAPFGSMAPNDVGVSLVGTFTACQSPTSFNVLESEWTATVIQRGNATEHSNSFVAHPKAGCETTELYTDPSATLAYSVSGTSDVFGSWRSRYRFWDRPRLRQQAPAFFRINLRNIPIQGITQGDSRLVSNASAIFFPTYDGKSECVDGLCQLPTSASSGRRITSPVRLCR